MFYVKISSLIKELNIVRYLLLIIVYLLLLTNITLSAKLDNILKKNLLVSNKLELTFKDKVKNINYFTIKKNGLVKHVYDIKNGVLPLGSKTIKYFKAKGLDAVRIGQFRKDVLRIVIESKSLLSVVHRVRGKKLTVHLRFAKPKVLKRPKKRNSLYLKRNKKLIILDAGHGGRDVGASNKRIREKNLTLSMTLKLRKVLKKMGYRVLMTRSTDKTMRLKERTDYANKYKGDIFISLHVNAAPKKRTSKVKYEGVTVFYLTTKHIKRVRNRRTHYRSKKVYSRRETQQMIGRWKHRHSQSLARKVRKNILKNLRKKYTVNDKGIKRQGFWVLLATTMPSILVETGYISNKKELKRLQNKNYQRVLVEGIAKGVNSYFGL